MQSHDDFDANKALSDIRKVAEEMTARGENLITAGAPNEEAKEETRGGFLIRQLPDDPLGFRRISVGEAHEKRLGESAYLVYRGDRTLIKALLQRALNALQ